MKRIHVWESYDWRDNNGLQKLKYGPACGTKCVHELFGSRNRPTCPSCGFVHYKNPFPGVVVNFEHEGNIGFVVDIVK